MLEPGQKGRKFPLRQIQGLAGDVALGALCWSPSLNEKRAGKQKDNVFWAIFRAYSFLQQTFLLALGFPFPGRMARPVIYPDGRLN